MIMLGISVVLLGSANIWLVSRVITLSRASERHDTNWMHQKRASEIIIKVLEDLNREVYSSYDAKLTVIEGGLNKP